MVESSIFYRWNLSDVSVFVIKSGAICTFQGKTTFRPATFSAPLSYSCHACTHSFGPTHKPDVIEFYDQNIGGVDTFDQMCAQHGCGRTPKRWPLCVLYGKMNVGLINSWVIHREHHEERWHTRRQYMQARHRCHVCRRTVCPRHHYSVCTDCM